MTDEKDGESTEAKPEDGEAEAKEGTEAASETESETGTETGTESETALAKEPPKPPAKKRAAPGAAWVQPLARFDEWWTRWEARLAVGVLGAEIFSLCTWIALKGMSAEYRPADKVDPEAPVDVSGVIFRALVGALVLGLAAHFALRPKDPAKRKTDIRYQVGVSAAAVFGLLVSRGWANAGSEYFSNLLNWLQSASTLTLFGGLRGLATRFTLWLALLGASLATAQGKHINVDVVMRYLTPKLRLSVALAGWLAASLVCLSGAWGFVDHLSIAEFKLSIEEPCANDATKTCSVPPTERLGKVRHEMARDLFLARRQMMLDFKSWPKVLGGTKYETYLHSAEWNEWIRGGDWDAYFSKDDLQGQMMDESDTKLTRLPLINIPGTGENTNGLLIRDMDFVFPFGLLMIGLRFLLRCLLAIGGAVKVDVDAAHDEPEIEHAHEGSEVES
ncbi:MAG TPA: TRAP transporter small permease subunit [Polyangiaceae bacterium]|nr:TRAP transporter small permease subunit [Polyangiaceae bacterium]